MILEGVDPLKETLDTFSIKVSLQTRTPLPRVRSILKRFPNTVKSGLDQTQARKLAAVLEELGGRTRIESYYIWPGERDDRSSDLWKPAVVQATLDDAGKRGRSISCPFCGWRNDGNMEYCSFCLEGFREHLPTPMELRSMVPKENPLGMKEREEMGSDAATRLLANQKLLIALALIALLLIILLKR